MLKERKLLTEEKIKKSKVGKEETVNIVYLKNQ